MNYKQGLLLFVSSCIPGCGQMHQGYMKRGLSLMLIFFGVFALAVFLNLGALSVLMLPVWLYAFFDSYNLRGQLRDGLAPADAFLFGLSDLDSAQFSILCQKRHSVIGWGLVAVGAYMIWNMAADWLLDLLGQFFEDTWWLHRILTYDIPRVVISALIIALGLWFIRGPKRREPEDIPAFTPPAADQEEQEAPHDEC